MKRIGILFAVFLAVAFASCDQASETMVNGKIDGMWIVPLVGTKYIYSFMNPGHQTLDTFILIRSGQQIGEKSNVMTQYYTYSGDTSLYNIESNGDFSLGDGEYAVDSLGNIRSEERRVGKECRSRW